MLQTGTTKNTYINDILAKNVHICLQIAVVLKLQVKFKHVYLQYS